MDNQNHPDAPMPPRAPEPPPALSNDLPEAHDKTTEQIHSLSNFSVSEAIGLPLLTKDVGKTGPKTGSQTRDRTSNGDRVVMDWREATFGLFNREDQMMFAAGALMVLGPLFFGMMRG